MGAPLREILAKFGIEFNDAELKAGDKAVSGMTDKLVKLGGLLAAGAAAKGLVSMTLDLATQADALAKQSAMLGLSTTELQTWQHAAGLSGVESEALTTSFAKLQKAAVDAATAGTGPAADGFKKLGVAVKDGAGQMKSADQLMTEVGSAIGAMKNPTERTAAAMTFFGRSGAKMIPLFASGADGIAKMRAEVDALGGGFSPDFAKRSEELNDNISRLNLAWLSFKVRVGGLVMPLIGRFVTIATKATAVITKWADSGYGLESAFLAAGVAALVLGRGMLMAGLRAAIAWAPMLLAMGALYLVSNELITLWQGGDTLIGRALDRLFGEGSAAKVVAWVKDVVKSTGQLFTDTERSLNEFNDGLRLIWFDFASWFEGIWIDMGTAGKLVLFDLGNAGTLAAASIQDAFARMWNGIIDGAQRGLEVVNSALDKIPGARTIIGKLAIDDSNRASTDNRANADTNAVRDRAGILGQGDARQAALASQRAEMIDRSITNSVHAPVTVHVNVPPGTPAQQARAVGDAAAKGANAGNLKTKNALAHTAG